MENGDKAVKSQIALFRCAKAAFLLSALKSRTSLHLENSTDCRHEETWKSEIKHLKMELVKERLKKKKITICALMVSSVQIMLLLFLTAFFWEIVLKAR